MPDSPSKRARSRVIVTEYDIEPEPEPQPPPPPAGAPRPPADLGFPGAFNLAACGCVGCHVADAEAPWILGCAPCAPAGGGSAAGVALAEGRDDLRLAGSPPRLARAGGGGWGGFGEAGSGVELGLDAGAGVLRLSSRAQRPQVVYLTAVLATAAKGDAAKIRFTDRSGAPLALGTTRPTEDAPWAEALTVVATVAPGEELRLATVSGGGSAALTTFVFPLNVHPGLGGAGAAALEPVRLRHFPLAAEHTPAFCTQGVGGRLTHFYPESFHAIDFRCAEGTPLLAVGDGTVTALHSKKSASGISAANLTEWNALT